MHMADVVRTADVDSDTGGAATLVLASGVSSHGEAICTDRLTTGDAALVVALRQPPDDWRASHGNVPPTWFVTTDPHADSVRTVANPGDLTGIGIAVSEFLDLVPADTCPCVCLDSLTTLLQYCEPDRAYRFLQVLSGRVLAADGTLHCHADPDAHDDAVLDQLAGLFDDAILASDD